MPGVHRSASRQLKAILGGLVLALAGLAPPSIASVQAARVALDPPAPKTPHRAKSAAIDLVIDLSGLDDVRSESLYLQLWDSAIKVLAQAPSSERGLGVRAILSKSVDEDGNLGFDLEFRGRLAERSLRWPQLRRRCALCTDGELVQTFESALFALVEEWKAGQQEREQRRTQSQASPPSSASKSLIHAARPELAHQSPSQHQHPHPHGHPPVQSRLHRATHDAPQLAPPRSWGPWSWIGAGLALGGASVVVIGLATIPRDVPVPGRPTHKYPFKATRTTHLTLGLGASALVTGAVIWTVDRMRRRRCRKQPHTCRRRSLSGR